ncbi:class F sortase [Pedobacter sp.]|nr:class F sortase [Candidatus Saccharibacteria bacterium]
MTGKRVTLNSASLVGSIRVDSRSSSYERRPVLVPARSGLVGDGVIVATKPIVPPTPAKKPMLVVPVPQPVRPQPSVAIEQPPVTYVPPAVVASEPVVSSTFLPAQPKKHNKTSLALVTMAVILFVAGISVVIVGFYQNNQVATQVKNVAQSVVGTTASRQPDETKPDAASQSSYTVGPTKPRMLIIDKLGVNARVHQLGVDSNNELQTPNNIYDTGWYDNSAKPGDAGGAILIDGHVHGPTQPGVFYKLKTLVAGDIIKLERGDDTVYTFKVVKSQTYPVDNVDMNAAIVSAVPGKLGLNLMTCTGSVNTQTQSYNERLIVFAVAE